jgi:1-deoxy-D-xylulose-5-phosphate synthase
LVILPSIHGPGDIRGLSERDLFVLAEEIRETIIATVAKTGGHLGSSLGVVEITLALHRLLESPREPIVWDTGHQAYPHKLVTGRYERFGTLRQLGGIGGFPRRSESEHDVFDGGHAGTGLSIAAGLATARDTRHGLERIAVVVGDAALMSGLSLEALNDIGHRKTQILIVLNDNEMSISQSVGALSKYLSEIKLSNAWKQSRTVYDRTVERVPVVGPTALELSRRVRKSFVSFAQPGQLFEDLGITYVGVVPGHDLRALVHTFRSALDLGGPVLVHVRTQKGRGYHPAEKDQVGFHGAALPPMADTYQARRGRAGSPLGAGEISATATGPGGPGTNGEGAVPAVDAPAPKNPNYTHFFAQEVVAAAREDRRIVAITAGMPTGTGLNRFQDEFPDRFVDVGIAEQHAVALATGIAMGGGRPVVAIYATFLQRAFDQIVHDVCQNDQPVLIGVDRAGLVGEDGTSHQGMFSFAAHRQVPNLVIAAPKDEQELRPWSGRPSPRTTRSPSTTRATPGSACPSASPRSSRSAAAKSSARGPTSSSSASGPSSGAPRRQQTPWPPTAGRSASSMPASPSRSIASSSSTRRAAGSSSSRSRRARRRAASAPASSRRSRRPAWRTRPSATSPCGSSGSRPTGSWITDRSPTCGP